MNPAAVVTVNVARAGDGPEIRLSSQPPMDDGADCDAHRHRTDRAQGGLGRRSARSPARRRAGRRSARSPRRRSRTSSRTSSRSTPWRSTRARCAPASTSTDKIYVGYVRALRRGPEKDENEDEVRVEYRDHAALDVRVALRQRRSRGARASSGRRTTEVPSPARLADRGEVACVRTLRGRGSDERGRAGERWAQLELARVLERNIAALLARRRADERRQPRRGEGSPRRLAGSPAR